MKRLAWSEVRTARQPGLKQELRVLIELLRVLPRPSLPTHLTILPSNIMVGEDGSVLVGAAPLAGALQQERYLAPEVQCGADPLLPAAIYAVGALLYEAVTGHRFETRDHVTQELAGARAMARAAGLGARFWEIYLLEAASKATEEQPEARWVSGSDFAEDLDRVARDRIVTRVELGRLVAEVLEGRSSHPPARASGVPEPKGRSGPPPLPKRARRRTSSQRQKAVTAPAKAARPAPIPRTDGDAPQMPLITALRVPARLKLPDPSATASAFSETEPPTLALQTPAPASAFSETEPPTLVLQTPAPTPASAPVPEARPVSPTAYASGSRNPVKLGPRIEPELSPSRDLTPSVAPVVVPSLSAPPTTSHTAGVQSRRRTLTGTGDLREFEQQFVASLAVESGRHGTLLGLGDSTILEGGVPSRESAPSWTAPPSASQRQSSGPPQPGAGAASTRSSSPGAPVSSHPPSSSGSPSSSKLRYVHSPTLESGWDAAVASTQGRADTDSSVPFLPKKSLMGRVLLMVVVLVALGIGTFEMYGHFASDQRDPAEAAQKPAKLDSKPASNSDDRQAEPSPVAVRDPSPAEQPASAASQPTEADREDANAMDPREPPPSVVPDTTPADPPPPRATPRQSVRAVPARPVAPPRAKSADRDYGI